MPHITKDWKQLPAELAPTAGETVADWRARIAAYAAANPTLVTPLNAAALEDLETRLGAYADSQVAAEATARVSADSGKQATSEKGQANGYAGLDGTGKVPSAQLPAAGSTSGDPADPATIRKLSRPRVAVGMRGTIYKEGYELIPAAGKTLPYPLQVRAAGANLSFGWGAFYRAEGVTDPLPLTHFYMRASVLTPLTTSIPVLSSGTPLRLLFNGEATKRVDPGAYVRCDAIGGSYNAGVEAMVLTYVVGEGTLGVLGAAIASTAATSITGPQLSVLHPLYGKQFYIQIDSEYLKVTAGTTGTTWTVARAQGSTTAATHSNGATVGHAIEVPSDKSTASEVNSASWDGDQTMNPATATDGLAQHFIYTPSAMYVERLADQTLDAWAGIGDSRMHGQGESRSPALNQGFFERACDLAGVPYANLAAGGTSLTTWTGSQYMEWRLVVEAGATGVVIALGTNRGLETGAQLLAQLDVVIDIASRLGLKVIVCTIPPSTDPGATPGATDANRIAYNQLIRSTYANDARVWRVADSGGSVAANSSNVPDPDGQFWGVDAITGILGGDLHDSSAGHSQEAIVLADAIAFVAGGGKGGVSTGAFTSSTVPAAPVNTVAPAVTGTTTTGSTLTCSTGTWSGYPAPTFTRQWKRNGVAISGATGSTYVLQAADEGTSVKCTVTATNSQGSASADSNTVTPTAVSPPANTLAPAITGTTTTGNLLSCSNGTWTGSPTSYAYQWKRAGVNISGATSNTYTLQVADEGTAVKCTVTATNAGGSTSVDSNTVNPTAPSTFDPTVKFDLGYGIGSDLGSNGTDITSWGHTLSLVENSTGLDLPTVATVNGKKVARFDATGPQHLGKDLPSAESMPFEVWMVSKHAAPIAGHVSKFFSPHPGSSVTAQIAADADFPADVVMTAGADFVTISSTSLPGAWHVWRFIFNGATGSIEVDGSEVASGSLGGSSTLSGFHLGSEYFGTGASGYDVAAWGLASSVLGSSDAADALAFLTDLMP